MTTQPAKPWDIRTDPVALQLEVQHLRDLLAYIAEGLATDYPRAAAAASTAVANSRKRFPNAT